MNQALALSNSHKEFKLDYDLKPLQSEKVDKTTAVPDQPVGLFERPKIENPKGHKYEEAGKRTPFTSTYVNNDGTRSLEYSTIQQNYQDGKVWKKIENKLSAVEKKTPKPTLWQTITNSRPSTPTPDTFTGKAGVLAAEIKPLTDGVTIHVQDRTITMRPAGVKNVIPERRSDSSIVYKNAWPGVDLEYELRGESVKEIIVIKNKNAQTSFNFDVNGGKVVQHPTRADELTIDGLPEEFSFSSLTLDVFGRGVISEQRVSQAPMSDGSGIAVSIDGQWMKDQPASSFPMRIDPSFARDATSYWMFKSDGYSCGASNCYANTGSLYDYGWKSWRTYFQFPFSDMAGKTIIKANLHGFFKGGIGGDQNWRQLGMGHANCISYWCQGSWVGGTTAATDFDIDFTGGLQQSVNNRDWGTVWSLWGEEGGYQTYKPYWNLQASINYDTPTPIATPATPADKQVVVDSTTTLKINPVSDADGDAVKYYFRVTTNSNAEGGAVINSGWISAAQWTIPDGILQDGTTYYWHVYTLGARQTNPNWVRSFKIDFRNGKDSTQTYDTVGPVGVNLATGSASVENGSHTMSALGGPIGVSLSYDTPNRARKGLTAEYWNVSASQNTTTGAPTSAPNAVRIDPDINFDWSTAAPDSRIGTDHFYTRWTGKLAVPVTGDYTFGASIDDDYAVYINGTKVASSGCCYGSPNYANAVPVALQAGQLTDIRVEFHEATGLAYMKLFVKGAVDEQVVPRDWLFTDDPNGSKLYGLNGRYYTDNANAHDLDAAAKDPMRLMFARQDTKMNLNFGTGGPAPAMQADNFMARWTGYISVPSSGDYQLGAYTDDGLRIKLNNGFLGAQTTPIDAWRDQAATIWSGNTHLEGNVAVPITIDWYEHGGGAALKLYIRGNGLTEQEIPASWLTPKANALPDGWQLNLDVDGNVAYERLRVSGNTVILEDSSRLTHEYMSTGSGYKPPLNEDGVLVKNGDNTFTLTDVDGRVYIFDSEGKLKSVTTPADDRQPAALKYEYGNDPSRLLKIVDGVTSTRFATLHYKGIQEDNLCGHPSGFDNAPNGMLCAVKTSDGDITHFYYQQGQLARIEKPGNDLTDYRYNAKSQIDTIRDGMAADAVAANVRADDESVTTQLVYDSLGRIRIVKAPAATAGAARLEHTFSYLPSDTVALNRLYRPSGPVNHILTSSKQLLNSQYDMMNMAYALRAPAQGAHPIYSCMRSNGSRYATALQSCHIAQNINVGIIGYLYDSPTGGATKPMARLRASDGYVLEYPATSLSGWTTEEVLGYGYASPLNAGVMEMHVTGATEPQGFSKRIEYDSLLRTTKETDLTGKSSTAEWDSVKDLQLSTTDATGLKSTTIYDNDDRPTDSYGPAPAGWYGADRKPLAAYVDQVPHTSTGYDEGINGPAVSYMAIKQRNSSVLPTGGTLLRGQSLQSTDGRFTFIYQTDGNVVLYGPGGAIWANNKGGVASTRLVMQGDGNLVLYNGGTPVWASNTSGGSSPYLKVQNDGNAVIFNANGGALWATNTARWSYESDNPNSLIGTPLLNKTNLTENSLQVSANWSTSPIPSGSQYWGARMTGKLRLPATGNWKFRIVSDNGVMMSINDSVVINDWEDGASRSHPTYTFNNTGTGSSPRLAIDYYHLGGAAANFTLYVTPPGQAETSNVAQYINPGYNLSTSTTAYDNQLGNITSTTKFANPAYGTVESTTLDPSGINYSSKATYEAPGTGYLRQTSKTLPGGSTTTYQHYSAADTRDNPCTSEIEAFHQAGLPKSKIEPDPDGTGPQIGRSSETIYDESGEVVATRYNNDPWSCVTYDARGRATKVIIPTIEGRAGNTLTNDYAVGGNPLVTNTSDSNGTITVENDLLGRTVKYTDAKGNSTVNAYDKFGKLESRTSPLGAETYTYDEFDRLTRHQLDGVTFATVSYDELGRIQSVQYPDGISLSSIGYDSLGRESVDTFTVNGQTYTDQVERYVSGDVKQGTENGVTKSYQYDHAGRLASATIGDTTFNYEFGASDAACDSLPGSNLNTAKSGNRTKMTMSGQVTTYCYDMADRLISSSDSTITNAQYDSHGNTVGLGDALHKTQFTYDALDRNISVVSGDKETIYTRDAQGRIVAREHKEGGVAASTVNYGFNASGDSPDFVQDGQGTVIQKYLTLPGDVIVTIKPTSTSAGATTYTLPNIHGDAMLTIDADGQVKATHRTGPFGEEIPGEAVPVNTVDGTAWNYLGQHQKLTDLDTSPIPGGIIQMGARVYVPTLGRFLQVDPIEGGTDNNYAYANDPVNEFDLGGSIVETIADVAGAGYDAYQFYKKPSWGNAGMLAWSVAAVFVPCVPGSYAGKGISAGVKVFTKSKAASSMVRKAVQKVVPRISTPIRVVSPKVAQVVSRAKVWVHNAPGVGVRSTLFGNDKIAKTAGILNRRQNTIKIGWSHVGTQKKAYGVFRIGWQWKGKKYHIDLLKSGVRWW